MSLMTNQEELQISGPDDEGKKNFHNLLSSSSRENNTEPEGLHSQLNILPLLDVTMNNRPDAEPFIDNAEEMESELLEEKKVEKSEPGSELYPKDSILDFMKGGRNREAETLEKEQISENGEEKSLGFRLNPFEAPPNLAKNKEKDLDSISKHERARRASENKEKTGIIEAERRFKSEIKDSASVPISSNKGPIRFGSQLQQKGTIHGGYEHIKFVSNGKGFANYEGHMIKLKKDGTPDMREVLNRKLFGKYMYDEQGNKILLSYKNETPVDEKFYYSGSGF